MNLEQDRDNAEKRQKEEGRKIRRLWSFQGAKRE